ncbi:MAG: ATP-dependent zinc metalloprotease FtsH [Bacteroides sp.]
MDNSQNNNPTNSNAKPKKRFSFLWLYVVLAVGIVALNFFYQSSSKVETNWQEVRTKMLEPGYVSKLVAVRNQGIVEVYLTNAGAKHFEKRIGDPASFGTNEPHFYFTIGSVDTFERQLQDAQKDTPSENRIYPTYEDRPDYFSGILTWIIPFLVILGLWFFIFRMLSRGGGSGGGGANIFNFGKSKAQLFNKENYVHVDFSDVAGLEEAKIEVREVVDFLKNPAKYTELGGKIPKGVLLVGPPGTGKTLLAKAVAGEANVPFFSLSGSDFIEMFVGVGASRVRDLFKQAKEKGSAIIFIDEIDAIGRSRSKNVGYSSSEERENTLNQLLTEMDGFSTNQGVIVLAATNRADILDGALLRAGRFDRQIHVELPDVQERYAIFQVHLKPLKLAKDFDSNFLAKQTPGFSGADIANVCNEAALIAARKGKEHVEKQDFLDAIDRIVGGLERKSKILTTDEKKRIAYHESGHATVSWLLEYASPLLKVSIIPRGRSLGAAWYVPEERQISTKTQMFHELCAILGGRAAEDVVFGEISTGALNDLERANKMAYAIVAYYGMEKALYNTCYYDSTGSSEYSFNKPFSEHTAQIIDQEVQKVLRDAYQQALDILREHRTQLDELAGMLLKDEVIFSDDLERIYGKRASHTRFEALDLKTEAEEAKEVAEGHVVEATETDGEMPKVDEAVEAQDDKTEDNAE